MNGQATPSALLYRGEDVEHSLPINNGRVEGLEAAVSWSEKGELCSVYEGGPLPKADDKKDKTVSLSVFLRFPFLRKDGSFGIEEINEGAKDGSKILKSLAPTGLGFAAPGLKTLIVVPEPLDEKIPIIKFMRDGRPVNPEIVRYNQTQYIRLKDMKSAKVDAVIIENPYNAFASFKINLEKIKESEAKRVADLTTGKN